MSAQENRESMKRFYIFFAILLSATMSMFAQSANNDDEVIKIDHQNMRAYRQGEVIVKFKEDGAVQMAAPRRARFATTQVSAVDQLFQTLGVDSVEELMPFTGKKILPRRVKAYNGRDVEPKNLGKLYRIKISASAAQQQSVHQVIEQLKSLDEVEYAEPNYLVYAMSSGAGDSATYVQEPLYSQQWGPAAINLPFLWNQPKVRTKRPVIAILDTGVDIEHPDLAANIWTNTAEANGVSNQDDDNNGFKDDIHGWDFINQTGTIRDFNGHGTHCAGIAAAVGDNGIGITGANPDALIMPVTIMQSDGTGDVATIIKGIDYAAANGADVISMSFGGYAYSIAEEQALGRAYATAILVAAAGNDIKCINPHDCLVNRKPANENGPTFPAALSFVLGVEASSQSGLANFSNFDDDGPIYSEFGEEKLYNYELRAPGVNIMSTFPGGRYKSLNGTSMACPMVAGAISRLLQVKTDSALVSKEVLFGDLIHSRPNLEGNINMQTVYNYSDANRKPSLSLVALQMKDSLGDNDGRYDAGETIALYPVFRNEWGMAQNIRYWMKLGFYNQEGDWVDDDASLITFLTDTVDFQKPLSSYAKATAENPLLATISSDCVDGRRIHVTVFAVCDNITDTLKQMITLEVENGVEIGGMLYNDLTLFPNVQYIVTTNLAIPHGVTLTIKPGCTLQFKENVGISNAGNIVCVGTPDSLITLKAANDAVWSGIHGDGEISYCYIDGIYAYNQESNIVYDNCVISNCSHLSGTIWANAENIIRIRKSNFVNNIVMHSIGNAVHSNISNNIYLIGDYDYWIGQLLQNMSGANFVGNQGRDFSLQNSKEFIIGYWSSFPEIIHTETPSYLGTSRQDIARKICFDLQNTTYTYASIDLSNMLTRPSSEAHGIVWKVVIDGYDAQDEFDMLPPLGVGTHTCQVYFNRAMDTQKIPYITYGVRPPYTQHAINENGSWSADSTIYTAEFTITGKTASDGLNRICVADAEDNEHFEIPLENMRFNMEIAAAGSMSTGLMATPGLGKVTLDWETDEEDFADLLGYNIYRWTNDTIRWEDKWDFDKDGNWGYIPAGWRVDSTIINETLLDATDQQYIDYDVVPGKIYYYTIKQVTTSLSSYDLSNVVTATPLTAKKGDANGSMQVDVADVITEVNYIMCQNPQPFIFEAADVNNDSTINIFDVVGTINIIMHPETQTQAINTNEAYYYIENGILYVESDVVLGGVQFTFEGEQETSVITPLEALAPFEKVGQWNSETQYMFMAYSMSGKTLGVGTNALLQVGDAELQSIVLSDVQGHNVAARPIATRLDDGTVVLPGARKVLENGNIYIIYGNRKYTATGLLIK